MPGSQRNRHGPVILDLGRSTSCLLAQFARCWDTGNKFGGIDGVTVRGDDVGAGGDLIPRTRTGRQRNLRLG
jgi:hypothetical protein